ncbi:MAG TPA: hypothetical protein VF773_21210 [Verrucomicrobiae bacterium]
MFVVNFGQKVLLFDCPFDVEGEDYRGHYQVYEIAPEVIADVRRDWTELPKAGVLLGEIEVAKVQFDETRRQKVNIECVGNLFLK